MLCKELIPSDPRDPNSLELTSELRAVGSVVRAMCANKTVAILECKPNLSWNGTLPSCDQSDGDLRNLSSILIIVWVIGGVLLFTLIVLIAIIIGSRSKPVRRVNGQPASDVFHISGQGEGGDNPAFSRSEERCGSSTRLTSPNSNTRLPSYQEAIRGLYSGRPSPSAPSSTSEPEPYFVRANAPPSYRSSHLYRTTNIDTPSTQTTTTTTSVNELTPRNSSNSNTNTCANTRRHRPTASQSSSPFPRPPTPGVTRSAASGGANSTSSTQQQVSTRYAENYPQCLWEEDPPPPYTPGPNNIHLYRSPSRTSPSRTAIRRSLPSRSRPAPPIPTPTSQPQHSNPSASDNGGRTVAPPASNANSNIQMSNHHHQQHPHYPSHGSNNVSTVASADHPLITYSTVTPFSGATNASSSGHFSTIHLTNTNERLDSHRNLNSFQFQPIQPVNQNFDSLHSAIPAPHNQLLGPPLSSSTPVPVRRDVNLASGHVPLPPLPRSNMDANRQHSRCHSHGNDPRGSNHNIPIPHRPLPRPRPQSNVHHDRQQSAPLARLEVEYF